MIQNAGCIKKQNNKQNIQLQLHLGHLADAFIQSDLHRSLLQPITAQRAFPLRSGLFGVLLSHMWRNSHRRQLGPDRRALHHVRKPPSIQYISSTFRQKITMLAGWRVCAQVPHLPGGSRGARHGHARGTRTVHKGGKDDHTPSVE